MITNTRPTRLHAWIIILGAAMTSVAIAQAAPKSDDKTAAAPKTAVAVAKPAASEKPSDTSVKTSKDKASQDKASKDAAAKAADAKTKTDSKAKDAASKDAKAKAASKSKDSKAKAGKEAKAKDSKAKDSKAKNAAKDAGKPTTAKSTTTKPAKSGPGSLAAPLSLDPAAESPRSAPASMPIAVAAATAGVTASSPLAFAPTATTSESDLGTLKQAVLAARRGRSAEATSLQQSLSDPLARKLVEWVLLRADDNEVSFARYNAFVTQNATWPSTGMLRRRAEGLLWAGNPDPTTVRSFFGSSRPASPKGRLALARTLLAAGDRAGAQALVRETWRNDSFGADTEKDVLDTFDGFITRADDKARMDRRLYDDEMDVAMRAANRLGGVEAVIAKARNAVNDKSANAKALLEAVPASARDDYGYTFSRIQWLRRAEHYEDAARLMLTVPKDIGPGHDHDEWWIERRLIARKLLDLEQYKAAYTVARNAPTPSKENYKVEAEFTAGWIALRFLKDPATASQHFARIPATGVKNPISLARAGYWLGRSAEAAGHTAEARKNYEYAARFSTAYYGQLARARLGLGEIALRSPPALTQEARASLGRLEVVRAVELLYALDEDGLVIPFVADLADRTTDAAALAMLADLCAKNNDARAVLIIGKGALARGLPLDHAAFPTIGMPRYTAIGPEVEPALVYSIARQESAFKASTVSTANALGLMQVTPEAGRYIAKRYGVAFDQKRLLSDNVYNVQMGAAELGGNIEAYDGSFILAFAGYNAGRGRVKEWIERFGDPRRPGVDPVDWVERIPFSETRNYVQRIMENVQAYRVRFGGGTKLMIGADLERGAKAE